MNTNLYFRLLCGQYLHSNTFQRCAFDLKLSGCTIHVYVCHLCAISCTHLQVNGLIQIKLICHYSYTVIKINQLLILHVSVCCIIYWLKVKMSLHFARWLFTSFSFFTPTTFSSLSSSSSYILFPLPPTHPPSFSSPPSSSSSLSTPSPYFSSSSFPSSSRSLLLLLLILLLSLSLSHLSSSSSPFLFLVFPPPHYMPPLPPFPPPPPFLLSLFPLPLPSPPLSPPFSFSSFLLIIHLLSLLFLLLLLPSSCHSFLLLLLLLPASFSPTSFSSFSCSFFPLLLLLFLSLPLPLTVVKKWFASNSDDSLQQTGVRISLKCPVTFKRINLPARGAECKHIQVSTTTSTVLRTFTKVYDCCG